MENLIISILVIFLIIAIVVIIKINNARKRWKENANCIAQSYDYITRKMRGK